jgi:hypothetical protein
MDSADMYLWVLVVLEQRSTMSRVAGGESFHAVGGKESCKSGGLRTTKLSAADQYATGMQAE